MSKPLVSARAYDVVPVADLVAMGPRADLSEEIQRLEGILRPAQPEEVLRCLRRMYRQFAVKLLENPEERQEVHSGYLLAMGGYPGWLLEDVACAFTRGDVDRPDFAYMPKAPEVGVELRRRIDPWRIKLREARQKIRDRAGLAHGPCGPRSPEMRAYGDRRVAELRASAAEKRRSSVRPKNEWVDPNPITREMLEAANIPDAPTREDPLRKAPIPDQLRNLKR